MKDAAGKLSLHGVLVEVFGVGVLLIGEPGIGKSETALDLIRSGHTLVADDAVNVSEIGGYLVGSAPKLTFELLEVRGLGILNIRELFGTSSVTKQTQIELCVELVKSQPSDEIDRMELQMSDLKLLGLSVPKATIAIGGRNSSTLAETAVRIFLQRKTGVNDVRKLVENHTVLVSSSL